MFLLGKGGVLLLCGQEIGWFKLVLSYYPEYTYRIYHQSATISLLIPALIDAVQIEISQVSKYVSE